MDNSSTAVAVTGAGGSLGTALVSRLLRNGRRVRALAHKEADVSRLRELGAEPVRGDVRESAVLEELARDCRVVFHLAAWMGSPFDEELAYAVNVGGTENVVRAAAKTGAERVVLASSIAVYGPVLEGTITEESPTWSVGDLYSDTKIEAEGIARREAERLNVELVVLRPTMIYGPESPSWTEVPFGAISRGLPVVIGGGEDLADPIYVEDVARAFELAGSVPEAADETFNVGSSPETWNTFLGGYAKLAGKPLRHVPAALARAGAQAAGRAEQLLGRRPRVSAEMVGAMTSRAVFSHDKASRILGFEPEYDLERGMRETGAWLRRAGLLRRPSVALVTGASGGLGRATAASLRDEGVTVWAADIEPPDGIEGVNPIAMDVTSEESIGDALVTIEQWGEGVDLLVNVAGLAKPDALERQEFSDVELQFDVNAYGPLRLARAVAPGMRRRGWGRIVNVSSTNGFIVTPFMGAYSASKYALEALSDSLRMELAPWGVEVMVVEPGAMKTGFSGKAKTALRSASTGDGWDGYLEAFSKSPLWGSENSTSPEKVADYIVKKALSRRVPARRLATLDAYPSRIMSLLPTVMRDAFFIRASGLHRRPQADDGTAARRPAGQRGR